MGYLIHTGWWCDNSRMHPGAVRNESDPRVRSQDFFEIWYECIKSFSKPDKVIVVDSASPIRPRFRYDVEFVSLRRNYLHAENCDTKLCGWTRAFIMGLFYALMNDVDYSVFIEQDCVIIGGGIIEQAIAEMESLDKRITYGSLRSLGDYIEQSLVIVKRDYIMEFVSSYLAIEQSDNVFSGMAPELKFRLIEEKNKTWCPLPFGYGRERPINYGDAVFFVQQMTSRELEEVYELTGLRSIGQLLQR